MPDDPTPLQKLTTMLVRDSGLQSSEGFDDKLEGWLRDAVRVHSAAEDTFETLAEEEYKAVVLLAWISLCYARASKFVNTANTSGAHGYGVDRDSPYRKNMDMAVSLQKQYETLIASLQEDAAGAGVIRMSELVVTSDRTDRQETGIPRRRTVFLLTKSDVTSDSAVLRWLWPSVERFADLFIYSSDTAGIYQDFRAVTDDGIPFHSSTSEKVIKISDQEVTAIRVSGLEPSHTYYYVAVIKSLSAKVTYSNEVVVITPDA